MADVEVPGLDEAAAGWPSGASSVAVPTDVAEAAPLNGCGTLPSSASVGCTCCATTPGWPVRRPIAAIDLDDWRWVLGVNLWGVIHGYRAFLPHLVEHGDGHIVNTASMAGRQPGRGAYTASKWAIVAITEGLYQQLKGEGSTVGVSCLCPGWVNTDIATSDRNRPEWAAPRPLEDQPVDERMALIREFVLDQLHGGMPPAQVAELVHDTVVEDRFWVFTDMDMVTALQPRFDAVLAASNPPLPTLGPR